MLTGLLCMFLGTAWAGGDPLKNDWSGEYDSPGNLTITVAPLRLAGQEFMGRGFGPTGPMATGMPTLDMTVEFRAGGTRSFALTAATSLSRATDIVEDLPIPGIPDEIGGEPGAGGIEPGTGQPGTGQPGTQQDPGAGQQQPDTRQQPGRGGRGYQGATAPVEVGLQVRDYIIGGFDNGLFVGGQVGLTNPDFRNFRADRTRFGPLAGLKLTVSIFTIEARGGADVGLGPAGFSLMPRVDFATGVTF
ncbi:MAG: hypothetical protein V4850_08000 [Myxococcota bacterium]